MAGTVVFQSNTLSTPGAGIVVAVDPVNGTVWQLVKLDIGPAGTSIPVAYGGTGLPLGTLPGGTIGIAGTALVKEARAASAAVTSVAALTSDTVLLALNLARFGAAVYAEGPGTLFLKLGNSSSTTSYTAQLTPQTYYEIPGGYTGAINGIWGTASGTARITEIT